MISGLRDEDEDLVIGYHDEDKLFLKLEIDTI
jgi:hypothetical protein